MKRLVTSGLGLPVRRATMPPPVATAPTPFGSAAASAKATAEPPSERLSEPKHLRCTVTIAGYYAITVPCA